MPIIHFLTSLHLSGLASPKSVLARVLGGDEIVDIGQPLLYNHCVPLENEKEY